MNHEVKVYTFSPWLLKSPGVGFRVVRGLGGLGVLGV